MKPSSLQGHLTPINHRYLAAGFPRPAVEELIVSLRAGYSRLLADEEHEFPPARSPLPAPVAWAVAELAWAEPRPAWATRFSAVVLQFALARRTAEVLSLRLRDVTLLPGGGASIQVRRYKGGERRVRMERLVVRFPPAPADTPGDLPFLLLRRVVARLRESRAPPDQLIFSVPDLDRPPSAGDLTSWLLVALGRLGLAAPPGEVYSSYSCRSGGATALHVCGVSRAGVARLLGHSRNDPAVANAHYVDALAPATVDAWWLCGRYARGRPACLPPAPLHPMGQTVREAQRRNGPRT